MEKRGIDISAYQRGIDFNTLKVSVDFIILRAGFTGWGTGVNYNKDSCFEDFYKSAKSRNIPVGAYWYSCANTYAKGKAEAEYMYKNCLKGKQFEYPICIDVEEDRHQKVGKERVAEAIKGFCEYLENKGYYVSIYANSNYFMNYIDTAQLNRYDKWLAVWSSNKPAFKFGDYGMWQNSSNGNIAGMRIDTDIAYKDYPTIIKNNKLNGYENNIIQKPELKDNETIAQEVINGLWGNGEDRKNRLNNSGYNYEIIQEIVNGKLKVNTLEKIYIVKKGDNLTKIAKRFGTTYNKIAKDNNIVNPNIIYPGQKLVIK